jgi:hypothetical protein
MSGEIDDGQLRQYLLGQLTFADRENVVERLARDERYFDAAEALEAELRDAFVRAELSPRDRQDFERHLLRTPRQKDETVLARHLTEALDRPLARAPARIPRVVWWGVAAALAMLTIRVGLENRKLRLELDAARHSIPDPAVTRPPLDPAPAPEIASLYLAGVVVRGSEAAPELVLSPRTQLVRLEADPELEGPLRAELENSSGRRVWTQALPSNTASPIRIWLPAGGLAAGIYTLRIDSTVPPRQAVYRFSVIWAKAQSPSTTKPAQ